MNLVEKLMSNPKKIEKRTKKIYSPRLSNYLGEKTYITIQEIEGRKIDLIKNSVSEKRDDREYEVNLGMCAECIVDPPVKNQEFQKARGAVSSKDLCEKLFQTEVFGIAMEIANMSSINASEEDVKN